MSVLTPLILRRAQTPGFNRQCVWRRQRTRNEQSILTGNAWYEKRGVGDIFGEWSIGFRFHMIRCRPLIAMSTAPAELTCDSYVDDNTGASLCSTGFVPIASGEDVPCGTIAGTEIDGCDEATCCEGKCACSFPVVVWRWLRRSTVEMQWAPSENRWPEEGFKHNLLFSLRWSSVLPPFF